MKDNGIGIPESEFERIFAPFFRLEAARRLHPLGLGVGLTSARRIALLKSIFGDGAQIQVAGDGRQALELLKGEDTPDLILLDLRLPEIDGFQVLEQLRKKADKIPVIILTSSERQSDIQRALLLGARAVISKIEMGRDLELTIKVVPTEGKLKGREA